MPYGDALASAYCTYSQADSGGRCEGSVPWKAVGAFLRFDRKGSEGVAQGSTDTGRAMATETISACTGSSLLQPISEIIDLPLDQVGIIQGGHQSLFSFFLSYGSLHIQLKAISQAVAYHLVDWLKASPWPIGFSMGYSC